MPKLYISRFTTRILTGWCVVLAIILLTLTLSHVVTPNTITLHPFTFNGFLAALLMGLRIIVLFLVFSTLPMRWPVTLLTFLSLTMGIVAISQFVSVLLQGQPLVILLYLVFILAFCGLLYIAIVLTSETIQHNDWGQNQKGYLINWGTSLLSSLRRFSLPLLVALVVYSVVLPLTNHVTF
ncbi:hypothetical protein FD30_GL002155 [Levilactobacillus namurensis DSM 19117]|uniref:Uncharacterized protein n=1 Tax=Levilactobacillus namurensis DSM 19117 TaxID=1423773 RepID=A0A0R1K6G6_9LACO|nr:hypothetical protein [Levilactobacillus namurensis]KRK74823.1 hypothetical protein FD30_GL002155 [Levilactobacillus namurensis DSM 19117]GEO74958.1 hypothetical protein LNA02_16560 [Levilactobacillus namurensis]